MIIKLSPKDRAYLLDLEKLLNAEGHYQAAGMCVSLLGGLPVSSEQPFKDLRDAFYKLDGGIPDNGLEEFLNAKTAEETRELGEGELKEDLGRVARAASVALGVPVSMMLPPDEAPSPNIEERPNSLKEHLTQKEAFVSEVKSAIREARKEGGFNEEGRKKSFKTTAELESFFSYPPAYRGRILFDALNLLNASGKLVSTEAQEWLLKETKSRREYERKRMKEALSLPFAPQSQGRVVRHGEKPAPVFVDMQDKPSRADRALDYLFGQHKVAKVEYRKAVKDHANTGAPVSLELLKTAADRLESLERAIAEFSK